MRARRLLLWISCIVVGISSALAQQRVTGTVLASSDGEPIIGASILVKGTQTGTITDYDGKFVLTDIPQGRKLLVISYIGMKTQEIAISPNMKVFMENDAQSLDEVVVVAYGTAKKSSLTGAIAVVDSKQMESRVMTSAVSALEGTVPGVQVNSSYGMPGSDPGIRIRGINTYVSGAESPLYVVDGVPFDGNMGDPHDGNISDLNPADIESMSVLKDASASALYGNRASNGVIIITTKRGREYGKVNVTLSTNQGFYTRGIPEYERLGADEWMEQAWMGYKNTRVSQYKSTQEVASAYATKNVVDSYIKNNIYDKASDEVFDANGKLVANRLSGYDDLDWFKELERMGHRQEYNLSVNSTGEKFNIYASVGYLNEKGYIIQTGFERYSGRINASFTPTKWLKLGFNLNGSTQKQDYKENIYGTYNSNPFYKARNMAPVYPVYMHNEDGSYALDADGNRQYNIGETGKGVDYLGSRHVIYEMQNNRTQSERNTVNGLLYGTITLPYGLSATVKADLNRRNQNQSKFDNPYVGDGAANNGRLTNTTYQYKNTNVQEQLNWAYEFGKHHIDVLAGHENYEYERKYSYVMNVNMMVDGNYTLGNFVNNATSTGYNRSYKTESYLSRARYNFDQRYFAEASIRRDGSSRFSRNNRWGNFFSAGASWMISKEAFMKPIDWVNNLKLRASYGEVGNDASVSFYGYMPLYDLSANGGNGALIKQTIDTSNIRWETTQTIDFGLDARLFNRLNVSVGYFDKRTKDLLFEVRMPFSAGAYPTEDSHATWTYYDNIGTISNRGWELAADVDIIQKKDWTWNVGADATFIKNKVVSLAGGDEIARGTQRIAEGHSMFEFYTYHFVGVDQTTGSSLYTIDPTKIASTNAAYKVEIDGQTYTTRTTYAEKQWCGKGTPSVYGSFHSTLRWRDLTLKGLFTYSLGGKIYDYAYKSLMSTSNTSANAMHVDMLQSWTEIPEGMTEDSPNRINPTGTPINDFYNSQYNNGDCDRWLVNGSYLCMKSLNLAYRVPKSWIAGLGIDAISVNAGVENLFTIAARKGLNPQYSFSGYSVSGEDNNTFVTARIYNLGVTVQF